MWNSLVGNMWDIVTHCEKLITVNEEIKEIISILDSCKHVSREDKQNIIKHLVEDFWKKQRKDGSPYINHLKHTLLWVIEQYGSTIWRTALLVALLHDSIEDTKLRFEKIQDIFWWEIALCVEFLSKKAFWKFIWTVESISEEESVIHHEQLGTIFQLLSAHWVTHEYQIDEDDIPYEVTSFWKTLKAPYKKAQQDEYFQKFSSRSTVRKELYTLAQKRNIALIPEKLEELEKIIITVKLSDRLHNLSTLTENHQKKIEETLNYLKNLIKEILDTPIWRKLSTEISWLQHQYEIEALHSTW